MDKILLRVPEAAGMTGLSRSYLYRMVLAGEIPHIRFGRAVRIPRAALDRWIEQHIEGNPQSMTEVPSKKPALRIGSPEVAQ